MIADRYRHPLQYLSAELDAVVLTVGNTQGLEWAHGRQQDVEEVHAQYNWHHFQASPGNIALMSVRKLYADSHNRKVGSRQAIAVVRGSQFLIGTARDGILFNTDPSDDQRYAIGIPLGESLLAGTGVVDSSGYYINLTENKLAYPIVPRENCGVRLAW